ncbi:Transketolase, N-terminal [Sesbania bispinosa]|nr:Transketolase, N-terminal [Sesbania bispinosa]
METPGMMKFVQPLRKQRHVKRQTHFDQGAKEVDATRKNLGWPYELSMCQKTLKSIGVAMPQRVQAIEAEWNAKFAEYEKKYKEEAAELKGYYYW